MTFYLIVSLNVQLCMDILGVVFFFVFTSLICVHNWRFFRRRRFFMLSFQMTHFIYSNLKVCGADYVSDVP